MFLQILKESVDNCNYSKKIGTTTIPTCELGIDWKGQPGMALTVCKCRVNLVGAKAPNNFFNLRICPPDAAGQLSHCHPVTE